MKKGARIVVVALALLGVLLALGWVSHEAPEIDLRGDVNLDLPQHRGPWGTSRAR